MNKTENVTEPNHEIHKSITGENLRTYLLKKPGRLRNDTKKNAYHQNKLRNKYLKLKKTMKN